MKKQINHRTLMTALVVMLISLPVFSQGGPPPGGRPGGGQGRQFTEEDVKNRVKRLSQDLNMTEEQEKQLTDFEVEQYKKNQVERQKMQGDWEKMREYMRSQREVRDTKYKEVLDEDQYKKYQELQEQRRQEWQNRRQQNQQRPGGRDGDRPARGRGRG